MSWFMDVRLAQRLERTEGALGAALATVHASLAPEIGSMWADFDGTYAIFDGPESPMTQTFGLGAFAPVTPEALAALEEFFTSRGAQPMHEVTSLAGAATHGMLAERGYVPIELSTVLVQDLVATPPETPDAGELRVRVIEPAERAAWVEASVLGWSDNPVIADLVRPLAELAVANPGMQSYVVERAGAPIATASLGMNEGIALLAGASTIPAGRGLGAQALVLAARLADARRRGCEIAMMVTEPGSTSQRNAERRGFRVAYTRTKWRRATK